MNTTMNPGKTWLDTDGKRIQAHGGSVLYDHGKYYWYGENKENTTGENDIWHNGVKCYSSIDLYNWKDEGIIIPADYDNKKSPLYPTAMMDRPHIIYNPNNNKYVAWLKIMGEKGAFAVLTADTILGPYTIVNPSVNPCGLDVGDFDLAFDDATAKAYVISQKPHTSMYIAELNSQYTDAVRICSEFFHHDGPPYSREAPAHFIYHGKHYMFTSGTTGYFSNPSEIAVSSQWNGEWTVLGNPHRNDPTMSSFNSQITSVFKVHGKKDLYIAAADRWRPELPQLYGEKWKSGEAVSEIQRKFEDIFKPGSSFVLTEDDAKDMRINSSISNYVWLPVHFDVNDTPYLEWMDSWKIEDYEDENI